MIVIWDGSVKPLWNTLRDHSHTVDGWTITTAQFCATQYANMEEFIIYNMALEWFMEENGYSPLTVSDFKKIQAVIEEYEAFLNPQSL